MATYRGRHIPDTKRDMISFILDHCKDGSFRKLRVMQYKQLKAICRSIWNRAIRRDRENNCQMAVIN